MIALTGTWPGYVKSNGHGSLVHYDICPVRELDPIGKLANEHEFKIQFINLKLTYTQ